MHLRVARQTRSARAEGLVVSYSGLRYARQWLWSAAVIGGACALAPGAWAQGVGDAPSISASGSAPIGAPLMAPAAPMAQGGEAVISLNFADTEISKILEMIAVQGDVEITINDDVQGKLRLMIVKDKTPEQAIGKVARTAGLQWRKVGPNDFIVAKELPPEEVVTQPIVVPQVQAWAPGQDAIRFVQPPTLPAQMLPELAQRDGESNGPRDYHSLRLKNVTPSMMAYWLDRDNNPEPLIFSTSRRNLQGYFKQYLGEAAFDPSVVAAQNGSYMPSAQSLNPYALPGSYGGGSFGGGGGFNQFASAYTQSNAQFGGGFGNQNGNGGGRNGGRNGNGGGRNGNGGGRNGNQNGGGGGNGGGGVFELPEGVESITAVDPQNALLVFSTQEGFSRLQDIVNFLDLPLRQVEIEAQFVSVNTSDVTALGVDFNTSNGPFTINATGFAPGAPSTGGSLALGFTRGNFQANLRALLQRNRAKVVTAPRVTAINNLTASLTSQTSTPVVTVSTQAGIGGNIAQGQNVNFITTGIGLTVTPTINNDDTITVVMQPQVQQQSLSAGGLAPSVTSQSVQTVANVRDGDTIVLGGLRTKTLARNRQDVPLLSRIPLLGALFRRKEESNLDQDLIIFLTARIIRRAPIEDQAVPGT